LTNNNPVTGLDTEGGGHVRGKVLVTLLVTGVLRDEVEVFATDDKGTYSALSVNAKPSSTLVLGYLPTQHPNVKKETYGASWWFVQHR